MRFWGPFVSESATEVGGSFYLPSIVLFTTRLLSSAALFALLALQISRNSTTWMDLPVWTALYTATSFLLISLISLQVATRRTPRSAPSRMAAPLYYVGASLAVYVLTELSTLDILRALSLHAAGALLVLADFLLGSRIRFRLFYILIPQLFLLAHTIAIAFSVEWLPARSLAVRHAVLLAVSFAVLVVSRASFLFCRAGDDQARTDGA